MKVIALESLNSIEGLEEKINEELSKTTRKLVDIKYSTVYVSGFSPLGVLYSAIIIFE